MLQALAALVGAAAVIAACYVTGAFLIRWSHATLKRDEHFLLSTLAGAPILHLAVFALFALHLAYKGALIGLLAAILTAGIVKGLWRRPEEKFAPLPRPLKFLFGAIFTAFTVLYLSHAWAPEVSADGAGYHLGLLARYIRHHGFERVITNMYAGLSAGVEMLFAPAFAIGAHSAGALVHFAFTVIVALLMLAYGRRIGKPWAGAVGALLMYLSPVVGMDGSSAYIDVAVAAIAFGLFYLLELWDESRNPRLLVPIGLLAGYSFASKYTAFVMVIYAIGFVLWRSRRIKPVLLIAACAALMIAPWLVKNWVYLENPVSPFANDIFRNPYVHVNFEKEYAMMMARYDVKNKWTLPLEVTVSGERTTGVVGATFLLAPLALFALRFRAGRRLLVPGVMLGALYLTNVGTRFLIPCLPFISLAMALALSNARALLVIVALFHTWASWPTSLRTYAHQYVWALDKVRHREALRVIPQEKYLSQNYPPYLAARLLDAKVPKGEVVLAMHSIPESYTSREVAVSFQSAWNEVLTDIYYNAFVEDFQPRKAYVFRFPSRTVQRIRVAPTTTCTFPDVWSVHEVRFLNRGAELPRARDWRLSSWPNPWDIQMAFDNAVVTRWRSWELCTPAMHIDTDFAAPKTIDEVRIETSRDQANIRMRIEVQDESGRWTPVADTPEELDIVPRGSIRLAATRELMARGIHYLLLDRDDFGAADVREDPEAWGLEPVGSAVGSTVYKVVSEVGLLKSTAPKIP